MRKNSIGRIKNIFKFSLRKKIKTLFFNLFLAAASLFTCILLIEGCIRLFIPQNLITRYGHIWRPDDLLGWRRQENVNTIINSGEGKVRFVTDHHGFRINAVKEQKNSPADKSIAFIGDSFLEAIQVENQHTIPQFVKRTLDQKYAANIAVINAGVGGWGPNHYYLEAKRLSQQEYDLAVVFLYTANDIVCKKIDHFSPKEIHRYHRLKWPSNFGYEEIIEAILYPINDFLECRSHLFVFLKNRSKWLSMKLGLSAYYFPMVFDLKMRESPCWQTTTEICKTIHDEFSSHNTSCFFVILPSDYQVNEAIFQGYAKSFNIDETSVDLYQPNTILKNLFDSYGLILVDPTEFLKTKTEAGMQLYGSIDSHFTIDGNKAVAEYITRTIESCIFM